jgi:MarR family transcriptional regulator, 2-MHQ and catechol-resistance regulon repressor
MILFLDMKLDDLIWLGQRLVDTGRLEMQAHAPGVPTAEIVVMRNLMESSPNTITALANRTGYAQSRVSTAVSGLVNRGWVQTGSDPADGRRTLVSVPDHIRQAAHNIQTSSDAHTLEHLLARRSPDRRQAIVSALEELLDLLREQAAEEQRSVSKVASPVLNGVPITNVLVTENPATHSGVEPI